MQAKIRHLRHQDDGVHLITFALYHSALDLRHQRQNAMKVQGELTCCRGIANGLTNARKNYVRRDPRLVLLLPMICIGAVGCSNRQNSQTAQNAPPPAEDGNLAPLSGQQQLAPTSAPPPPATSYTAADYPEVADNAQPVYAPNPPPPLPDYNQPPCPGDGYIWTPGYWNYANSGYYWVPGVWVLAPYVGALWTPPWWGFYEGRYRWHPGYWGTHIGFYGGVNYGHGYTGHGYYGGYWNRNTFVYNRSASNVNTNLVHNVYDQRVNVQENSRASYNGGPRGIDARPLAAEVAALRETHTRPVAVQVEHVRAAESNREQFASVNGGRPKQMAQARPLATPNRAPAARPAPEQQVRAATSNVPARPETPLARPEPNRPNQARPETRPGIPERQAPQAAARSLPESRPRQPQPERSQPERSTRQARPETPARAMPQARPEPAPRAAQARPEPQREARPEPQREARPTAAARPAPQSRPAPEAHPAPQQRPASRPAPREKPEREKPDK